MPQFIYNAKSNTNQITYDSGSFHYLLIMLSNCSYNGNSFVADIENLESLIQIEFGRISNLEFRGVGCSMMRGNTDSLTLGISAGYYDTTANLTALEAQALRLASNDAISNVSGLFVSEVRVETTLRQQVMF
jgi:hypothetical protein